MDTYLFNAYQQLVRVAMLNKDEAQRIADAIPDGDSTDPSKKHWRLTADAYRHLQYKLLDMAYELVQKDTDDLPAGGLPPNSWFTEIGGWFRVRIPTKNADNEEIGCGRTKEAAALEAWAWYAANQKNVVIPTGEKGDKA